MNLKVNLPSLNDVYGRELSTLEKQAIICDVISTLDAYVAFSNVDVYEDDLDCGYFANGEIIDDETALYDAIDAVVETALKNFKF